MQFQNLGQQSVRHAADGLACGGHLIRAELRSTGTGYERDHYFPRHHQAVSGYAGIVCDGADFCATTEQFPRGCGFLVDQLNRAALSISANIAEGNGRFTQPDRKNFFGIARGSVQECVPLLELARRRKLIDDARHAELKSQLEEISKMLSGLINGLESLLRQAVAVQ